MVHMHSGNHSNSGEGRWGGKYVDKRDWPKYNEELIVRGEFLLDMSMFDNWESELKAMNDGKRGRPFKFPIRS